MNRLVLLTVLAACVSCSGGKPLVGGHDTARWTDSPIELDGLAKEKVWETAEAFILPYSFWTHSGMTTHLNGKPSVSTRCRFLWDDQYLYYFAELEDDDIYANVTTPDGPVWNDDVLELFLKPRVDDKKYYELNVNAANTRYDGYYPSRGSGSSARLAKTKPFNWRTAVHLDGTLNNYDDEDKGWSVEGRIPWSDLEPTGGKPKAGDEWKFAFSRWSYSKSQEFNEAMSTTPLDQTSLHRYEAFATLHFEGRK